MKKKNIKKRERVINNHIEEEEENKLLKRLKGLKEKERKKIYYKTKDE